MDKKYFIGEMTSQEFKEALHTIIFEKDENIERTSFKQKIKDFYTFKWLKDFLKDCKDDFIELVTLKWVKELWEDFLYIAKLKFIDDFKKWLSVPLTQEVFIKRGKNFKRIMLTIIETVIFVIVFVMLIRFYIFELRWIPSGSMKPTLIEGDKIVVDRYYRFKSTPKRGDIMVFYPPMVELKNTPWKLFVRLLGVGCKDTAYIKRVIGTPGDTVEIKTDNTGKSTVYINSEPLDEPYIMSPYDFASCKDENVNCGPTEIPQGYYLMMGDNRGSSFDGRYWGLLPQDRFIGRAVFVFWPINRIKGLRGIEGKRY